VNGHISWPTHTGVKEHHWHIWLEANKLAVAKHKLYYNQRFQLHDKKKNALHQAHMDQLIRKETEIELHPNSMDKEDGLDLKEVK
jgi:hypothetical protein